MWLEGVFAVGFAIASLTVTVSVLRAHGAERRAGGVVVAALCYFGTYITWRIAREAHRELKEMRSSADTTHSGPPASPPNDGT